MHRDEGDVRPRDDPGDRRVGETAADVVDDVRSGSDGGLQWLRLKPKQGGDEAAFQSAKLGLDGKGLARMEIVDALGDAPDIHCLPVGNAGNITAYWRGYTQYRANGPATRTPRMWGFQAAGAAPLVLGHPVLDPETVATAPTVMIEAISRWDADPWDLAFTFGQR